MLFLERSCIKPKGFNGEGKGKTKGFLKTRVKDSIKPSALVFG